MYSVQDSTVSSEVVRKTQFIMLDILKVVHDICEKNNFRYWLSSGTLLGCVRHNGFIPWDDDLDIAMPRKDYEKFLEIAQGLLPEDLFLQTKLTDKAYSLNFAKIRKLGTKLVEVGEKENEDYFQGIFIDIFPCDNYPSKWFVKWMRWSVSFRNKRKNYKKGSLKRILFTMYSNVLMIIPVSISVKARRYFENNWRNYFYDRDDYPYLSYGIDCATISMTKVEDTFPLKKELPFEGEYFYIPKEYKRWLELEFGQDYMTLPPVYQRKVHARKIILDYKGNSY